VQFKKGRGKFFIHTSPLAFSNYFVLHKGNNAYFRQAFSVIPATVTAIVWNEYYLEKKDGPPGKDEKNWLATLFQYPAFKWGFFDSSVYFAVVCAPEHAAQATHDTALRKAQK
jgi:hypothetical protein